MKKLKIFRYRFEFNPIILLFNFSFVIFKSYAFQKAKQNKTKQNRSQQKKYKCSHIKIIKRLL
jgi:hypothetical protein